MLWTDSLSCYIYHFTAAVCQMAQYDIPSNVVLALLELCTAKSNSDLTG